MNVRATKRIRVAGHDFEAGSIIPASHFRRADLMERYLSEGSLIEVIDDAGKLPDERHVEDPEDDGVCGDSDV
jgi:hypothetical protein